jgi:hypothetical protein
LFYADGHMDKQTDTDRRTDMTKLIVTFCSYANAPKMYIIQAEIYTSALFLFWDDVVGIATRYGLNSRGPNPGEANFSAPVQTGSGAHSASYTVRTGAFPGVKRPEHGVTTHLHLAPRLKKE